MEKLDDNIYCIAALVAICLIVAICGARMTQVAGNIASAACGSIGTLLTGRLVSKGGP